MLWLLLIASFVLGGLSFPGMFFRADERPLLAKARNLRIRDGDDNPSDGIEDAWERLVAPGRFLHDLKNIGHEWVKANPKVTFKGGSFLIVTQFIVLGFVLCLN
jgi:hypothetical protein